MKDFIVTLKRILFYRESIEINDNSGKKEQRTIIRIRFYYFWHKSLLIKLVLQLILLWYTIYFFYHNRSSFTVPSIICFNKMLLETLMKVSERKKHRIKQTTVGRIFKFSDQFEGYLFFNVFISFAFRLTKRLGLVFRYTNRS